MGRHFGVYQILSLIGAGGMGEVYRALETKLRRDVAREAVGIVDKDVGKDLDRCRAQRD